MLSRDCLGRKIWWVGDMEKGRRRREEGTRRLRSDSTRRVQQLSTSSTKAPSLFPSPRNPPSIPTLRSVNSHGVSSPHPPPQLLSNPPSPLLPRLSLSHPIAVRRTLSTPLLPRSTSQPLNPTSPTLLRRYLTPPRRFSTTTADFKDSLLRPSLSETTRISRST